MWDERSRLTQLDQAVDITDAESDATMHSLECLDVWGGNDAIHSAISVPGIDAWISSDPYEGDSRGGDIYYVSMCGCAQISRFVVADVSGHGTTVGHLAHRLRKLMRKHINKPDQTRLARALNREFSKLARGGQFATALLATYFPPTDHLIICNAGHPRPMWYHAISRTWELLDQNTPLKATAIANLPLGIIEPTDYTQFAVQLAKGDLILIYTDALIESQNPKGEMLGEKVLLELVRGLDATQPQDLNHKILAAMTAYRHGAAAKDDRTLLVLHHNAADPPKQSIGQKMRAMAKMLGLV